MLFLQILIIWLFFSVLVGIIGYFRKIGFRGAFLFSLIFSPFLGIIFTLLCVSRKSMRQHRRTPLEPADQIEPLELTTDT